MKKFLFSSQSPLFDADNGAAGGGTGEDPITPDNDQPKTPNAEGTGDSHKEPNPDKGADDKPKIPEGYHSDAEVDKIINAKFAKMKAKEDEAKKMAKMDAEQRAQYKIEQLEKENSDLKGYKSKSEMTSTARKMASEAGIELRDEDLKHVVTADADSTKANLDWVKGLRAHIYDRVKKELLSGKAPKVSGDSLNGKASDYGARLAKQAVKPAKNPYFNNSNEK